jgi:F420-dependent oxidoreductase-like protein
MRIGLQLPRFDWPGGPAGMGAMLSRIARAADEGGFASLWLMDHLFGLPDAAWGPPAAPMLEGYTALSFAAAATSRLRLGLLVTGVPYRHPGVLVKTVTTLDVLTGGRAWFGLGAGWYDREATGLGVPFGDTRERLDRLEETVLVAKHMWRGDTSPFAGRYYQLDEPMNNPAALSEPHPPILIGGEGERRTLLIAARHADAVNLQLGTPLSSRDYPDWYREFYRDRTGRLRAKFEVLRAHCDRVGRRFDDIERTVLGSVRIGPGAMSAAELVDLCYELAAVGVQHLIVNMPDVHEITPIETIAREVIPQVQRP